MAATILVLVFGLAACSTTDALTVPPGTMPMASAPQSTKYSAIVVDAGSGKVLYDVDAGAQRYPASLTKMMTLYMLFEAIGSGRVGTTDQIPVSAYAASRPPSKLGLRAGEAVDVDTAIRALATKSANDVAVAVAEYLGGSEQQFAAQMTAKARILGLRGTVFVNASGLPDDMQRTTARDVAMLGLTLRKRYPQYAPYFAAQSFTFRGRTVKGHNDLIGRVAGVDGMKTGYIRASGFNICTSVTRGGRRLIVVVMGGDSARQRNDHVEDLIERFLPQASG